MLNTLVILVLALKFVSKMSRINAMLLGNILLDFETSPVFKELWQAVAFFSSAKARILQTGLYQLSMEHHGAYKYAVFRLAANILSITGLEKE